MTRSAVMRLRLAEFRSYPSIEIMTGGASVAMTGPNGAGKTNILEAVSLLVPGRGLRRAGIEDLARRPGPGGWRLRAEFETGTGTVEIVTGTEVADSQRRAVEIDGKTTSQTALARHLRMVWLTPAMDRLWTDAASGRRQFLDRMTMGFIPDHAEAALGYEKAMRARNRLLRDGPADAVWLGRIEAQMGGFGARIARARAEALARLSAAQEAAETLFPRAGMHILGSMETRFAEALTAGENLDSLEAEAAARMAGALGASRGRDAAAGRTLEGPHRSDLEAIYLEKGMEARACSTGEQKALLISLCLANARALGEATGVAPVLLFDEVAAHLDATRRRALFTEIAALGAQAWMTGTGAELFDGLEDARHFAVMERDGLSTLSEAT